MQKIFFAGGFERAEASGHWARARLNELGQLCYYLHASDLMFFQDSVSLMSVEEQVQWAIEDAAASQVKKVGLTSKY